MRRPSIALLLLLLVIPGDALTAQEPASLGTPLPLEVALSIRGRMSRAPINMSPDGEWLAHTVQGAETLPRDSSTRRFSPKGVPLSDGAWLPEATLSHVRTGEQVRLGEPGSASWAPAWSPDGRQVAYYSDAGGSAAVWVWDRDTRTAVQMPGIARPVFTFEVPRWTPDSRQLLVKLVPAGMTVADANALGSPRAPDAATVEGASRGPDVIVRRFEPRGERKRADVAERVDAPQRPRLGYASADLAIIDVERRTVRRLAELLPIRGFALSPDGRWAAFAYTKGAEPNTQQVLYDLVVVPTDGGDTRTLGSDVRLGYGIEWSWSPDSRTIAMIASGQRGGGEIITYRVADGATRVLDADGVPSFTNPEGEYPPLWDATGEHLYAVGAGALWRVDATSGAGAAVGSIPGWHVTSPVWRHDSGTIWSPDGGRTVHVIARARAGGRSAIYAITPSSGTASAVVEQPKSFGGIFSHTANERTGTIAFTASAPQELPEIWTAPATGGAVRKVSRINPELAQYPLGTTRVIEWKGAEGKALRGALLLPPGYRTGTRLPLVVWVYGGSTGSASAGVFGLVGSAPTFNMHVLATRGYAVLFPDVPIREGEAMAAHLGAVMPGVDAAIAQGFADPERLAVMGQSYGSYGTLALITQTDRFRAAIVSAAVLHPDLFADYFRSIGYYEQGPVSMGGTIWEQHDRYLRNSPLFHFPKIRTPLLIAQGQLDGDLAASTAIFAALERLQKPVELRTYVGEWHVIMGRENVRDFWERRLEFLAEHLDVERDAKGGVVFHDGAAKGRVAERDDGAG